MVKRTELIVEERFPWGQSEATGRSFEGVRIFVIFFLNIESRVAIIVTNVQILESKNFNRYLQKLDYCLQLLCQLYKQSLVKTLKKSSK